jgi:hypothetical protein
VNWIEDVALFSDVEIDPEDLVVSGESYAVDMDGTVVEDIEILKEEDELRPPLHFKKTSLGMIAGGGVIGYPPIPKDWYRGPTEQLHVHQANWKYLDVSKEGEETRNIKVGVNLSVEDMAEYKELVMEY